MTSNFNNKYKYSLIQNAMYRKFRILNSEKFPRVKNTNYQEKPNKYQYYPIESDNSKVDGHTIYLVTQDEENYNKDHDKNENLSEEPKNNLYINKNKNSLIDNKNFIAQRPNEFSIFRKYNYPLNWRSFKSYKNQIHISENKIYDFNKPFNETKKNRIFNNDINNEDIHSNYFNIINAKQSTTFENENNMINNTNKILTYRKKITPNQYKLKEDINNEYYITNEKNKSRIINKFNENRKNCSKNLEVLNTEPLYENKTINIEETHKAPISKNSSLNEYINVENIQNFALNRSLDEANDNNNTLSYKSLGNNILENFDNSKIMEKKFLDGIKNQQRKISLLKAMARYNRFKFRGKFNINKNNNNKIEKQENININEKKTQEEKENIIIKADIKTNDIFDNNNDNNLDKDNNNLEHIYNKEEKTIQVNNEEEIENENEFSFNSELRKNDKKNHLEEIAANNNKHSEDEDIIINKNEENEEKNIEIKINEDYNDNNQNNNQNNNDKENEEEDNNENEENNNRESFNSNDNPNVIGDNILIEKDEKVNNSKENQKEEIEENEEKVKEEKEEFEEKDLQEEKEEKEKEEEVKEIIKKEENEKIIKPEINISIDNKESPSSEKIIPEINISIDNKEAPNQNEKSNNKSDSNNNNNSSSNNIINNSINININNNDNFNKNDIRDQKQYIQLNNIKYKNNIKPGYFVRKVVREEHYYVDENGKEKIIKVKQEFINDEDKKKTKSKHPYKKRYINMVNKFDNSNLILNKNNKTETDLVETIKSIEKDKVIDTAENKNDKIDLNNKKEDENNIISSRNKEDKIETIIIETKKESKDPLINDNLSSASGPTIYPKYNNNYFKYIDNNNYYSRYNKKRDIKINVKKSDSENNIINISNLQTEPNIQKKEYPTISKNYLKNTEAKSHIIKSQTHKEYLNNFQYVSSNRKASSKTLNNDSNKKENNYHNINLITLSDNYIKVNKMDKFKNTNSDIYDKYSPKTYSLYNNDIVKTGKKRRESSKNHAYHEINLTSDKNSKILSTSLSNYFNESNDVLNTSYNQTKIPLSSNIISERNYVHKYNINTHKYNLIKEKNNKDNTFEVRTTNRFHRNRNKEDLNASLNKDHHRYYESKSIKKDRKNYNQNTNYNSANYDNSNKKEFKTKNIDNNSINKNEKRYFYSYYDTSNNKNSQTAKKISRNSTYYH